MKNLILVTALVLTSFNSFSVEVSPAELRQLQTSAESMEFQMTNIRSQIAGIISRGESGPAQDYIGSCGTDRYTTIGGEDCADLDAVLRRPGLSMAMRLDIEGAIDCAKKKAIQACSADNGQYCRLLPGYSSEKITPQWSGEVSYKCRVTAKARAR